MKPNETAQFILQKTANYNSKTYPLKTLDAIFTSDNVSVLNITPEGNAKALRAGTATIKAAFQGRVYTISVTVQDALKQVFFEPTAVDDRDATITKMNTPITLKMWLCEPSAEPINASVMFEVLDKDYRVVAADFTLVSNGDFAVFTRKAWWDYYDMFVKIQATIVHQGIIYNHYWDIRASEAWM